MLGLNETALLRRCLGRKACRNDYEAPGTPFACRVERTMKRRSSGDGELFAAGLRIFAASAANFSPRPGDRIDLPTGSFRVSEVRMLNGLRAAHHLEIELQEAGFEHER